MIQGKSILAIIPARGGSKGIPRKNIRMLAGKPLIAWTIEEAKKSKYIDRFILSSEDEEIIKVAKEWGCDVPFIRPEELAMDDTPGIEPVLHAINALKEQYDYVVLIQPTSPLRKFEDIDGCIEKCIELNVPACVSVVEAENHPYWMYRLDKLGRMKSILEKNDKIARRQELPVFYVLNGAVYVANINWLKKEKSFITSQTMAFIMPKDRSLDIDSTFEMDICEYLLLKCHN